MTIKLLPDNIVNQIAAGEVVERPASVIKELVENSIDAGATKIDVSVRNGGASFISVSDNGCGMDKDDLSMSIQRHATSKMESEDLFAINTFGFRGEALASISSIARVSIKSKKDGNAEAWELKVEGGKNVEIKPTALNEGTKIEIRDLFFATPARLKFLKADSTETRYIKEVVEKIAMANPEVSISLVNNDKKVFNFVSSDLQDKIYDIVGKEFSEKSIEIKSNVNEIEISGFIGVPSFNKANSLYQYVYVNGRPIKDKFIMGAIRAGYMDVIEHGRYPVVVLFIKLPPKEVDVNVHPAKTEVRFKDNRVIRGALVHSIREAIENNRGENTQGIFEIKSKFDTGYKSVDKSKMFSNRSFGEPKFSKINYSDYKEFEKPLRQNDLMEVAPSVKAEMVNEELMEEQAPSIDLYPMGSAKAQLHKNYIISQTEDAVFLIDQHAVHERIVYESIKDNLKSGGVSAQNLLIPEVVELKDESINILLNKQSDLYKLGLEIENFGEGAVVVRSVPALLKNKVDIKQLVNDLADELLSLGESDLLETKLYEVCATIACHGSVRSGRVLSITEMNELLRQMEKCKNIQQCNHGRPTYVKLTLKDIEKLFNR
ncbi:MAG: DNA mismatch repair endonuclease MutL [Alphaproteobacteria bacterium]|jgi:DNA mismatch repair protein MutL|nr:DNA mismatch repair endonuclease MutL [Alphaproteobacteria bacterium]